MKGSLHSYQFLVWAILGGLFFATEYPKQWGLYRWIAQCCGPFLIGMLPAMHYGVEWKFSLAQLAQANLTGQHALVTGANSGIGYHLTKGLVQLGAASVTLACRNAVKCNEAVERIRQQVPQGTTMLQTLIMDTSSLASVQTAAEEYVDRMNDDALSLDMLFLNAGTAYTDLSAKCVPESQDGIEYVFATNYLGHHLFYRIVEPLLQRSDMARVVSTSSAASFFHYSYKVATDLATLNGCLERFVIGLSPINFSYGQSKLAQIVWTKELTRRLGPGSNIYVNSFHPGGVDTGILEKGLKLAQASRVFYWLKDWLARDVLWSGQEGAHTGLFLGAQSDYLQQHDIRGNYYHPQGELIHHSLAQDEQLQQDLWEFSESLVQGFLPTVSATITAAGMGHGQK